MHTLRSDSRLQRSRKRVPPFFTLRQLMKQSFNSPNDGLSFSRIGQLRECRLFLAGSPRRTQEVTPVNRPTAHAAVGRRFMLPSKGRRPQLMLTLFSLEEILARSNGRTRDEAAISSNAHFDGACATSDQLYNPALEQSARRADCLIECLDLRRRAAAQRYVMCTRKETRGRMVESVRAQGRIPPRDDEKQDPQLSELIEQSLDF